MDAELLRSHWALAAAGAVLALVAIVLLVHKASRSAPAQLRGARRRAARLHRRLLRAERDVVSAEARLHRLQARAQSVKPRLVVEARGALEDAQALARIARDQAEIAENHVRRIITEEFPPAHQQRLRDRYLPGTPPDKRPFSF